MKMMEKEQFDIILPVGPRCRPAHHLRMNELRFLSSPLDWQSRFSLSSVIHLFQNKFNDFFTCVQEVDNYPAAPGKRCIKDISNNIFSIHHFPIDIPLEEYQPVYINKMKKRYNQINIILETASDIALICNREDSIASLKSFLSAFSEIYPQANITLINIRSSRTQIPLEKNKLEFTNKLKLLEYQFYDYYKDASAAQYAWIGNAEMWHKVLMHFCISSQTHITDFVHQAKNKKIIIYGAGYYGKIALDFLTNLGLTVNFFAVSDAVDSGIYQNISIMPIEILQNMKSKALVIIAVKPEKDSSDIYERLLSLGFHEVIFLKDIYG